MSELPQGWVNAEFGNLNKFSSRNIDPSKYPDEVFELYSVPIFPTGKPELSLGKDIGSTKQQVQSGDVLVCKINPRINRVWVVGEKTKFRQIASSEWIVMRAERHDPRFLGRYFSSSEFRELLCTDLTGVGGSLTRAQPKRVATYEIPLAPLAEQKRIADKLDALLARVEATRERFDRIPALLKRFRQSVLAAAFTGKLTEGFCERNKSTPVKEMIESIELPPRPNRFSSRTEEIMDGDYALAVGDPLREIPNEWRWIPLVDIARMESGHTPSRSHPEYWGGKIDWIGIADARDWHGKTIPETYQKTNKLGIENSAARLLPKDTICLSRTASVGYVVRMGKPMATSQDFANWTCTDAINPDWLKYLFMAETDAIYRFGKGSTHTTVYFPELMAFHVALPPIEEQDEIVRRIEALFALADKVEARYTTARAQVDKLTPALLAKAFRGELVDQDPTDEPADQLLARLREARASEPVKKRGRKARENAHD